MNTITTRAYLNGEWLEVLEINTSTQKAKVIGADNQINLVNLSDVEIWDQKEVVELPKEVKLKKAVKYLKPKRRK